jgi:hypothetical protein
MDMKELVNVFMKKYDHDRPLMYFDLEFKGVLGVDIYAFEFPPSQGYYIIDDKNADILILKLEHLNDCTTKAFR